MLARHGQRLSPCSLFVLVCQVCSHRRNEVEYFGDCLWITFLDARGAMPWKATIWCAVAVVLMTPFVILEPEACRAQLFQDLTSHVEIVRCWSRRRASHKQVQDDGVWDNGGRDDRAVGTRAAHLRAFVPLCEIHWRSVWVCSRAMGEGPAGSPFCSFWGISYVSP